MRLSIPLTLTLGAFVLAAAAACGGQPAPPPTPTVDSAAIRDSIARAEAARRAREDSIARARAEAERMAMERRRADSLAAITRETERVRGMVMEMINFDFDKSNIRPGDAATLDRKIAIMQANAGLSITITGHADERGSDEYNLALGNRRALAAKEYMVNRGIAANRVTTASRGEEQPLDSMSTEEAWAKNRRDEFAVAAGGQQLKAPAGM
ncbi:MAG: OmpA family protein [Gemmatimonadota bacterium]|nr:OmpA family protein [Gemmatimonadota bacterium]MDH5198157.1 OmpA family protein [Gemmatimonadota bacterium]